MHAQLYKEIMQAVRDLCHPPCQRNDRYAFKNQLTIASKIQWTCPTELANGDDCTDSLKLSASSESISSYRAKKNHCQ
jgi:hypothetical protein